MARKKRGGGNNRKGGTQTRPPARKPAAAKEPTKSQVDRLDAAEFEELALAEEAGPAPRPQKPQTVDATLEESLKRAERLLNDARGHFERLRSLEKQAEEAARKADEGMKAQTATLKQERAAHDAALRAEKKRLDSAASKRSRELGARSKALDKRDQELEVRAIELNELSNALSERDAELGAKTLALTERELNAERGFVAEKAAVLGPLDSEVIELKDTLASLQAERLELKSKASQEDREREEQRAQRWAEEDRSRDEDFAEARRKLDEEVADERQRRLEELRDALREKRAEAELELAAARTKQDAELNDRVSALDDREADLAEREKALRRGNQELAADQEMLADDQSALARKVSRLVERETEELRHEAAGLEQQLTDARRLRDQYFAELESRRELDRRFGDRKPEELLAELDELERQRDELTQKVRTRPDAKASKRLSVLEKERSSWLEERAVLQADLAKATGELATRRLAAIELETLRKEKEALGIHKQLLDGAVGELRATVDELTMQEDHRNPMMALSSLDESEELQAEVRTTAPLRGKTPNLGAFAEDLRHRIATAVEGRTLYYTDRDVRSFLGGLAMTRLLLLQGISGTGKTSLPMAFAGSVGGDIEIVEVQAGWRDRQDLVGYYNAFHRHYYATNFLQALYRAGTPANRDRIFMMVLDEVNLSRPEQFFADFLSALEQPVANRRLTLVNDPVSSPPKLMVEGRHLPIPPNVWFVGTANHDESTVQFADKTYDRAHVMEMPRATEAAQFKVGARPRRNPISFEQLEEAFDAAGQARAKEVKKAVKWLREVPFADTLERRFRVGWGNRLEQQMSRYLPVVVEAGGSVGEAVDHLLETKVLRKLKDRHDVRATALEELNESLLDSWSKLDKSSIPERCNALIEGEITAKKGEELV